jgi:hypothetical protein
LIFILYFFFLFFIPGLFSLDPPIPGSLSVVLYSWLFSLDLPFPGCLSGSLFLAASFWFSIPDLFLVLAPSFCFAPHWPLIKELGLQIKLSWNF